MHEHGPRLLKLLEALNYKQLPFAKAIGISQTFLNKIINGQADISRGILVKILEKFPTVNVGWILTGRGEMFLLSDNPVFILNEPLNGYLKADSAKIHQIADESTLKGIVAANLQTVAARWDLFNHQLFSLLDPEAGRQAISKYMLGQSIPGLPALVRLEYITSIPLSELITRKISAEELPPAPIEPGNVLPALLSALRRSEGIIQSLIAK